MEYKLYQFSDEYRKEISEDDSFLCWRLYLISDKSIAALFLLPNDDIDTIFCLPNVMYLTSNYFYEKLIELYKYYKYRSLFASNMFNKYIPSILARIALAEKWF